jgi:Flp pilus assembly protein TadB
LSDAIKVGGAFVLAILLIAGLSFAALRWQRVTQPYQEQTRRLTYENSQTYNDGMAIDLSELCRQMKNATDQDVKSGLAETIRLRAARYHGQLPAKTQECVDALL